MPTLAALGIRMFIGDSVDIDIPVGPLVGQLVLFLGCPIGLGMIVRARRPESAQRFVSMANRTAVVAVLVLTVLGAIASDGSLPSGAEFSWALAASVTWTLCAMVIGWGIGALLGLDGDERFTFLIEFSARNIALTFIIAVSSLGRLDLGFFAAAYSMTGFPLVIVLSVLRGRLRRQPAVDAAPS